MITNNLVKPAEILLVEDSLADILIIREAFEQSHLLNTLRVVEDGVQAMDYLHKKGSFSEINTPDLILLDLNLPKKNGREVLAEIKADPMLSKIPVVILTTSSAEEDILKAYNLHANCYVVKPLAFEKFVKAVQSINNFWLVL